MSVVPSFCPFVRRSVRLPIIFRTVADIDLQSKQKEFLLKKQDAKVKKKNTSGILSVTAAHAYITNFARSFNTAVLKKIRFNKLLQKKIGKLNLSAQNHQKPVCV